MVFAMQELMDRLLQERARETGGLRTFVEEAEKRDGGWTAEDKQEFERRNTELDDLDSRIRQCKDRIASDAMTDEYRAGLEPLLRPAVNPALEGRAAEEKRIADFFKGGPGNADGGRSLDISLKGLKVERDTLNSRNRVVDYEERTGLVEGTTTAGGYLFAPSFRAVLYQHLIFNAAIRQTRAVVLTTNSGENILLPKTTSHPTSAGTITPEGVAINESDPAFGQGTLGAYKYGNIVQVSSELEQDTAVDLLGYLAKAMGVALGNSSGVDMVTGSGTSKPQGVITGAGTIAQVTGGTPASSGATFAELTQVYDKIIPPYQVMGEWFMGQSALQKLRALTNSQGTPIFLPSLSGDQPDTLFGHPIIVDPNVAAPASNATSIAFGDFSSYFIRDVDGVRFERSVDYAFNTDLVSYRAIMRTDGRLLDLTGAIGVYKGGTA